MVNCNNIIYLCFIDKDSPNTSTAKSSRRDSLNERVISTHNLSFTEQELAPPQLQYHQNMQHQSQHTIPLQSPPIHHMMQDMKQELPVRTSNK